jgi:hypothetical protein
MFSSCSSSSALRISRGKRAYLPPLGPFLDSATHTHITLYWWSSGVKIEKCKVCAANLTQLKLFWGTRNNLKKCKDRWDLSSISSKSNLSILHSRSSAPTNPRFRLNFRVTRTRLTGKDNQENSVGQEKKRWRDQVSSYFLTMREKRRKQQWKSRFTTHWTAKNSLWLGRSLLVVNWCN